MKLSTTAILLTTMTFTAGSLLAAHKYDSNKPVNLNGTVTKIEWQKPYVKIHLGVSGTSGKAKDWEIQTAKPATVESDGLTRGSIKVGDRISIQGDGAANGSAHALARSITLADGRTVAMNGSQPATATQASTNPPAPALTPAETTPPASSTATEPSTVASNAPSGEPLPQTASNLPLIGLLGLGTLTAWGVLSLLMRRLN